ncbi:hypothetical protein [Burkholderia sp. 22PA0106]|uniref:hypothetical protein n=1 Tax=Burkholderia sp. 22PA0106 TaxID=3237371 RepID=UPI0039C354E2
MLAAQAFPASPDTVSADAIREGCSISFKKIHHPIPNDLLSNPPFSISAQWNCKDGEHLFIDKYDINGSSPQIASVFYWKSRDVFVLVKWEINSRASDYSGSYYEIFSYEYAPNSNPRTLTRNGGLEKYFPPGFDGTAKNGTPVVYPFKNAASIRKKLRRLDAR